MTCLKFTNSSFSLTFVCLPNSKDSFYVLYKNYHALQSRACAEQGDLSGVSNGVPAIEIRRTHGAQKFGDDLAFCCFAVCRGTSRRGSVFSGAVPLEHDYTP